MLLETVTERDIVLRAPRNFIRIGIIQKLADISVVTLFRTGNTSISLSCTTKEEKMTENTSR